PASRTACTARIWVVASVPTVQLASTLSMGFDSAACWISTGLGWSTAPAVKRHNAAACAAAFWSPTTANSSARLPSLAGSRPAACAPALNASRSLGLVRSRAWVIQPSPYWPARVALLGPPAATKIGGGVGGGSYSFSEFV